MTQPLVFVYGSLKRGQRAHHLLEGLPWLGQAWLPGACLHDLGPFPMAVLGEGRIQGELYGVGEADLAALDRYEGAPRLYSRQWLSLEDGRAAWVYLGRPHQVRHVAPLASGCWLGPSGRQPRRSGTWKSTAMFAALTQALGLALVIAGGLRPGWAFDTLGACQSWQNSRGQARIEVANSIGAAHYLTKMKRLQESYPAAPVPLYSEGDIARVCSER
ncbi:MAG: gamma-glutamylcyclotransferase [Cyanobacteria bacterium]|nr:gamma-glutamylcyclotransferase [Cyanobacteriota bacterium]